MTLSTWLIALATVVTAVFIVLERQRASRDADLERLAVFLGVRRTWGESDASLRRRTTNASIRTSSSRISSSSAPEVAWWARLLRRIARAGRGD